MRLKTHSLNSSLIHPDALKLDALAPHCDNCGWTDSEKHAYDETWINAHIGMTCPQCNHVIITEQDAADVKALHEKLNHDDNNADDSVVYPLYCIQIIVS